MQFSRTTSLPICTCSYMIQFLIIPLIWHYCEFPWLYMVLYCIFDASMASAVSELVM